MSSVAASSGEVRKTKEITVAKQPFVVCADEFPLIAQKDLPPELCSSVMYSGMEHLTRLGGVIKNYIVPFVNHCVFIHPSHGGFLPLQMDYSKTRHIDNSKYSFGFYGGTGESVDRYGYKHVTEPIEMANFSSNLTTMGLHDLLGGNIGLEIKGESSITYNIIQKDLKLVVLENVRDANILNMMLSTVEDRASNVVIVVDGDYKELVDLFCSGEEGQDGAVYNLWGSRSYLCFGGYGVNNRIIGQFKERGWLGAASEGEDNKGAVITADNLLELCIMVKNAGPQFAETLRANMAVCEFWTIYDTGSTDDTIETIKRVAAEVGKPEGSKWGQLICDVVAPETFHFSRERNRCLRAAGERAHYTIMLDDTYRIENAKQLRTFISQMRANKHCDSLSIFIKNLDTEYVSNRICKTGRGLKYKYRIHESIDFANNCIINIPGTLSYCMDHQFDYTYKRTVSRKPWEIKWLYEDLEEYLSDPRPYFYLGHANFMLGNHEEALKCFLKRAEAIYSGFNPERFEALLMAARIMWNQLKRPWFDCNEMFLAANKVDPTRPEPWYHIGLYHYGDNNMTEALANFKKGLNLVIQSGDVADQFNDSPAIKQYYLLYYMLLACYKCEDYQLGAFVCNRLITNVNTYLRYKADFWTATIMTVNKPTPENDLHTFLTSEKLRNELNSWQGIFSALISTFSNSSEVTTTTTTETVTTPLGKPLGKPLWVFVADGGYVSWTGASINKDGVGGSETYIIEMSREIQRAGVYDVIVFCNTGEEVPVMCDDVQYRSIMGFGQFIKTTQVAMCVISRFEIYLPIAIKGRAECVYYVLHDVEADGRVICQHPKLQRILCLTEWHATQFKSMHPECANLVSVLNYGVDQVRFSSASSSVQIGVPDRELNKGDGGIMMKYLKKKGLPTGSTEGVAKGDKVPYSFIYSSFANRGLLVVLQMWPEIRRIQPAATLNIYCDLNNAWLNANYADMVVKIRELLEVMADYEMFGIKMHGWVNKATLAAAWRTADIWFYPCLFAETFCLTAVEAAISGTLVISTRLAALAEVVGNRGVFLAGGNKPDREDVNELFSAEWQTAALQAMRPYLVSSTAKSAGHRLVTKNRAWAAGLTWKGQAAKLVAMYEESGRWVYDYKCSGLQLLGRESLTEIWDIINEHTDDRMGEILDINTGTGVGVCKLLMAGIENGFFKAVQAFNDKNNEYASGGFNKNRAMVYAIANNTCRISYSDEYKYAMQGCVYNALTDTNKVTVVNVVIYTTKNKYDIVGELQLFLNMDNALKMPRVFIINVSERDHLDALNHFANSSGFTLIKEFYTAERLPVVVIKPPVTVN